MSVPIIDPALAATRYTHGSPARYTLGGCRCTPCRDAARGYQRDRNSAIHGPWRIRYVPATRDYGVYRIATNECVYRSSDRSLALAERDRRNQTDAPPAPRQLVDATPAREHIARLQAAGMGTRPIAQSCGIDRMALLRLSRGEIQRTRRSTLERILAVRAKERDHDLVDAGPTWNLIRDLRDAGYSEATISSELRPGSSRLGIGRERIRLQTAKRLDAVVARLLSPDEIAIAEASIPRRGSVPFPSPERSVRDATLDSLVVSHLHLVKQNARWFARYGVVEFDDLQGEGHLALMAAARKYDPGRGVPFEAFARISIRGAMQNTMRRRTRGVERSFRTLRTAERLAALHTAPHEQLTSGAIEQLVPGYRKAQQRIIERTNTSLDHIVEISGEMARPGEQSLETLVLHRERKAEVAAAIGRLPVRLQDVVREYYFEGRSLPEIADARHLSRQRISQLHLKALKRLRAELGSVA